MAQPAVARQVAPISLHGALCLAVLLSSGQQPTVPAIAAGWAMAPFAQGGPGWAAALPDRPPTTPNSRTMRKSDRSTADKCCGAETRSIQFWDSPRVAIVSERSAAHTGSHVNTSDERWSG